MIGQIKLKEKLNHLNTLPNAIILVGDYGCGKHTYVNEISSKFNFPIEDISENINEDTILDLQSAISNKIYLIDSNKISEKSQNTILKFLEEPTEYAHIIILCEGLTGLLPTIINRCKIWYFDKYKLDDLKQIKDLQDISIYTIFDTPGKLLSVDNFNIKSYIDDAEKIFNYIDRAIISNILILPNKLSYKENDNDKLNFNIFANILLNTALKFYQNNLINFKSLLLTNDLIGNTKIFSIDKQKLYERYLIELKDELKRFKNTN